MRKHLGSSPDEIKKELNTMLDGFQKKVVQLYRDRAKAFAEREKARFSLIVVWKNRFELLESNIRDSMVKEGNQHALDLFNLAIKAYKDNIPMSSMSGEAIREGGLSVYKEPLSTYRAGALTSSFFDPSEKMFLKSFWGPGNANQQSAAKIWRNHYTGRERSVSQLMALHFLNQTYFSQTTGVQFSEKPTYPPPPSETFLKALIYSAWQYSSNLGLAATVEKQIPLVQNKFDEKQNDVSLSSLIVQAHGLIVEIIQSTFKAALLDESLDKNLDSVGVFLKDYNVYQETPKTLQDFMEKAQSEAAKPEPVAVVPVVPVVTPPPVVSVEAPKKANLGLVAALAAGGIYLLTRGS